MANKPITRNVFLDAEVFQRYNHVFEEGTLLRVAELGQHADVHLFLTRVTADEIRKHLNEAAKEVFAQLMKVKKDSKSVRKYVPEELFEKVDEVKLRDEMHSKFDAFLKKGQITILPVKSVLIDEVFDLNFARKAPFGEKGKKSEFPDVFSLLAIRDWCKRTNSKIYLVSNDNDLKRACENDDSMNYVNSVDGMLELFQDAVVVAEIKRIFDSFYTIKFKKALMSEAEYLEYEISDEYLADPEFDHLKVVDVKKDGFHVVHYEDKVAIIALECDFTIKTRVYGQDLESSIHDHETGDVFHTRQMHADVTYRRRCRHSVTSV